MCVGGVGVGCLCLLGSAARHGGAGLWPWRPEAVAARPRTGPDRPAASGRIGLSPRVAPTASGVARRAGRPTSADALCPTSTVRGRTVNNRPEAAPSVFSGASAAPRNAELAHRTPSGAKNGSCAVQLLSSMAPRPRLARKKRLRCVGLHPCELSRHESLLIRR